MRFTSFVFLSIFTFLSFNTLTVEAGRPKLDEQSIDARVNGERSARAAHLEAQIQKIDIAQKLRFSSTHIQSFLNRLSLNPQTNKTAWGNLFQRLKEAPSGDPDINLLHYYIELRSVAVDTLRMPEAELLDIQMHWSPYQKKNLLVVMELATKYVREGRFSEAEQAFRAAVLACNYRYYNNIVLLPGTFDVRPSLKGPRAELPSKDASVEVITAVEFYGLGIAPQAVQKVIVPARLTRRTPRTAEGSVDGPFRTPFGIFENAQAFFFRGSKGKVDLYVVGSKTEAGQTGENGRYFRFPIKEEIPDLFRTGEELNPPLDARAPVARIDVINKTPLLLRLVVDHGSFKQAAPVVIESRKEGELNGTILGPFAGVDNGVHVSFRRMPDASIRLTYIVPDIKNIDGFQYTVNVPSETILNLIP